jgi:hypothetical protein
MPHGLALWVTGLEIMAGREDLVLTETTRVQTANICRCKAALTTLSIVTHNTRMQGIAGLQLRGSRLTQT